MVRQDQQQLDLFAGTGAKVLDRELWRRRQDRRDASFAATVEGADAMLVPLALALARLSAQRDAWAWVRAQSRPEA